MGAFRPLEETARASAQISGKDRANPILPLSLYQKSPSKRYHNARVWIDECVLVIPLHGGGASWFCTVARSGFVPAKSSRPVFWSILRLKAPSTFFAIEFDNCTSVSIWSAIRISRNAEKVSKSFGIHQCGLPYRFENAPGSERSSTSS